MRKIYEIANSMLKNRVREYMSVPQVSEMTGLSEDFIRMVAKKGDVASIFVGFNGGKRMVNMNSFWNFLDDLEKETVSIRDIKEECDYDTEYWEYPEVETECE